MKLVKISIVALSMGLFFASCGGNTETAAPATDSAATVAPAPEAAPAPATDSAATPADTTKAAAAPEAAPVKEEVKK
jgi:hypothetical protein